MIVPQRLLEAIWLRTYPNKDSEPQASACAVFRVPVIGIGSKQTDSFRTPPLGGWPNTPCGSVQVIESVGIFQEIRTCQLVS